MKKTTEEHQNLFFNANNEALFDQKTLAAVLLCSTALLERQRWDGTGAPYLKIGRHVRYRKADVMAWINSKGSNKSTSEYGG